MEFLISAHTDRENVFFVTAFCKPNVIIVQIRGAELQTPLSRRDDSLQES